MVSLITHEEIPYLKVHDLPRALRDRHMEWWHAPIPDGEAPEQDFEHAWKATGESIRNRLRLGFDVLLEPRMGSPIFRTERIQLSGSRIQLSGSRIRENIFQLNHRTRRDYGLGSACHGEGAI